MPAVELNNNTYDYPTSSYPIGEYYTYYPTWGPTSTTTTTTTGVAGKTSMLTPTPTPYGLDDVVITGVSGRFPGFQNIEELVDDLYKPQQQQQQPGKYTGRKLTPNGQPIFDYPFDYKFFGIDETRVKSMDSGLRALVEVTYEAIFDSGFNTTELKGSKTGVFLGGFGSPLPYNKQFDQTQCSISSTYPVQLLNFFEFSGPYGYVDTTISSGLVALDRAFVSICKGECEQAIVGGIHNGTVGVVFLQKTGISRRFYAKIKTTKTIQTPIGEKDFNFAYQNGEEFGRYLREVYSENNIDPSLIQYVESHNPELTTTTNKPYNETNEYKLITDVFGRYRQIPLFVGSTKAYGYHDHGIVSLIKMLIAAQRGILPKTLKFQHPTSGEYLPVQETKTFNGGLMALNSFGYPGASVHVVLQPNCEQFQRKFGQQLFWNQSYNQYLQQPRLFNWSATNEQGLVNTLEQMHLYPTDLSTHVLLNPNSLTTPMTHPYRGFTILNGTKKIREYKKLSGEKRPVWFMFNGLGSQWTGMGKELMQVEYFKMSMYKIADVLRKYCDGFDLIRYLTTGVYDKQYIILLITSIQVAFVDLMEYMGVQPDGIIGYSFGEFAAAYADDALTLEETILSSYYLGKYIYEARLPESTMAVIGLSWLEARTDCPQSVVPTIYETKDTCIISGPKKIVQDYLETLKRRGVYVKEVESYGLGLHSYLMSPIVSQYKTKLESIIVSPKLRSQKWYSTLYLDQQPPVDYTRYASPEYFVNCIINPVGFYPTLKYVPSNAITVELGPNTYLQPLLMRTLGENFVYINFMKRDAPNHLEHFWMNFGRLYNEGINVDTLKLFFNPKLQVKDLYPVPHTTRFLSPFVSWNRPSYGGSWYGSKYDIPTYGEQYYQPFDSTTYPTTYPTTTPYTYVFNIDTDEDGEFGYLNGNTINGKIMFPTTGYLYLVWKALAESRKVKFFQLPVAFENVEFYQPIVIGTPKINLTVRFVDYETGRFEVVYGNKVVVSGRIYVPDQQPQYELPSYSYPNWDEKKEHEVLDLQEIYRDFRYRGYDYSDFFQNIYKITVDGKQAQLCWEGLWIPFLESMIQVHTFGKTSLVWPTKIHSIRINPTIHGKYIKPDMKKFLTKHDFTLEQPEEFGTLTVVYDPYTSTYKSGGVEMTGLFTLPLPEEITIEQPTIIERVNFVPYFERYGEQPQFGMVDDEYKKNFEFFDLYLNEVKYYISEIMKKVDLLTKSTPTIGLFDVDSSLYTPIVKLTTKTTSTGRVIDGKFLQLLRSVCDYPIDTEFTKKIRTIFGGNSYNFYKLWNDEPLFQVYGENRYQYLKSLLETVLENVPVFESQPRIKVLEIAPQYYSFSPKINEFLNAHPSVEVDYHYVPVGEYLPEVHSQWIQNSPFPMTKLDWNIFEQEMPSTEYNSYDLIIFNNSIGYTKLFNNDRQMFKSWFKSLTDSMLKPQGFFMLFENVNYRDILMKVSKFTQTIFNTPLSVYKYQDEEEWRSYFNDYFYPVSIKHDGYLSSYMLYRKPYGVLPLTQQQRIPERYQEIYVDNSSYDWIAKVQKSLEDTTIDRVWIISEDLPTSGIIGLVNCLRHETFGDRIRCVFIADQAYSSKGWKTQFEILRRADLLMNVFKNGRWGSYKHLFDLPERKQQQQQLEEGIKYAYVDWTQRGDLSTLKWMQAPEPYATGDNQYLVDVFYGGLNYRDYLIATGSLYPEHLITYKKHYDHVFGMEFSGYANDRRYMGITPGRGLSTVISVNDRYLWEIPSHWTLEQAATIPLNFSQAYYALLVRGSLKNGESVLIHSGATPFGQAAISIALGYNCKVFTTYTRPEEREFLMQMFPGKLVAESFLNINDDYSHQLLRYTNGGVNVVVNYLNEYVEPSIRCLVPFGRFVEMSDYIVKKDQNLWKKFNNKNIVYINFYFDSLFDTDSTYEWEQVYKLVLDGIRTGVVRPLVARVFDRYQIQDAFKQLINGPSFEKILVRICEMKRNIDENSYRVQSTLVKAVPKLWFSPYMTYIIHQGLTPFGLELTQWMVQRGAKKIMLISENSTRFAYEQRKLSLLRTMYDATIIISTYDPSDEGECILLMKEAVELSEIKKIGGIFSIDIQFQSYSFDKLYDSQFHFLMQKRYQTIYNLDKYSRDYTEAYFVVFSSLFSGRGFENSSLHGYMHSSIEHLCELRRQERRHAIAIQWGQIEDHFENENLFGTVPQSVLSTLKTLEYILLKSQYSTIWSTYVQDCKNNANVEIKTDDVEEDYVYVPTKQQQQQPTFYRYPAYEYPTYKSFPYQSSIDTPYQSLPQSYYPTTTTTTTPLYEFVLRLLKIQDEKFLQFNTPLVQYGMTMKLAKQLKDILEYQHKISMTIEDIQQLTFSKLRSMDLTPRSTPYIPRFAGEFYKQSTKYQYLMPKKVFYKLNDFETTTGGVVQPIFIIHPIEGHVNMLKNWAKYINYPVIGIQYTQEAMKYETIEQLADFYVKQIDQEYGVGIKFHLIGYSFGASVAFEMANRTKGRIPSLTFIDGSYMFVNQHLNTIKNKTTTTSVALIESEFLYSFVSQYINQSQLSREQFIQELMQWDNFESRVYYAVNYLIKVSNFNFDIEDLTLAAKSYVKRMFMAYTYKPTQMLKHMKVLLVRPKQRTEFSDLLGEDYGLNSWIDGKLLIKKIEFTEQQQTRGTQWIDSIYGHMFASTLTGLLGLTYNNNYNYIYGKF